jgi:aldose 1-epimerase
MFSIAAVQENGFDKIILTDPDSGTGVEILPSSGALLHAFNVRYKGGILNVIDQYSSAADFTQNVARKGFKSCKLSPFVCRLKDGSYIFGGNQYKIEKFYLGSSAIHGLLFDASFTILQQSADNEKASLSLKYEYRKADKGYPFCYDCIVNYTLKKSNLLTITTDVVNRDEGIIPVADGWHPYFTFGGSIDELQLEFQSTAMLEFDDGLHPTGKQLKYETFGALKTMGSTQLDNCFVLDFSECQPLCVLRDKEKNMQLEIYPDSSYPYLQMYTPPHRTSIAIENLSAAPDAFNNGIGLITLEPGEAASFGTTYKISILTQDL